jgi:adenylylsulfate kinase
MENFQVNSDLTTATKPFVIWMTGLPCAGKTTIAKSLGKIMSDLAILDGDELREWLPTKNDFSKIARCEHNKAVAHIAKLLLEHNIPVCVSLVSPYYENRQSARAIVGDDYRFIELYIKCSLSACEIRDVKGMYKRARNGEIKQFTGLDGIYEVPVRPDLIIDSENISLDYAIRQILEYLQDTRLVFCTNNSNLV